MEILQPPKKTPTPQAGGPINLNFLAHYDYWARWKALVTENSKMSSSGSFSLMPQRYQMSKASNLPFYFQKRQNRRCLGENHIQIW